MYTAIVPLVVNQFVPIGSPGCTQATFGTPTTTPPPSAQFNVALGSDNALTVTVSSSYQGVVQLTFVLNSSDYILLGIAVNPNDQGASRGRKQFPSVDINRDSTGSQITVTDSCLPGYVGVTFDYVIVVQQVSDGAIGLIDPDIENQSDE